MRMLQLLLPVISLSMIFLLKPASALLLEDASAGTQPIACRLTSPHTGITAICSPNASRIDLSGRGLSGRLVLTFGRDKLSHSASTGAGRGSLQLRIDLLDLSGNPGLTGVDLADDEFRAVQIGRLDISGTAMAPLPGRLLNFAAGLLSVHTLTANGTAYPEPLDLDRAADMLYRLRVQAFALLGWPLALGRVPANLTSHGANSCASKRFESITISRSRLLRTLTGDGKAVLAVSDTIDLSGNGLRIVSNVTVSAGRIDLSDNHLVDLPGVTFRPGSVCRAAVTGPPTLLLARNRLSYAVLDSLAGQVFTGLDLSGNEHLLDGVQTPELTSMSSPPLSSIAVSESLNLSGLGGQVGRLADLLARFRPTPTAMAAAFHLDLADNWIPDLASATALVANFVTLGVTGDGETKVPMIHLDLSENPLLVHLNLSDMPPNLLASLTAKRLPHLRSASVRVQDGAGAGVLERLRRRGQQPDGSVLAGLWSQRVPLRLDAHPDRCCLTEDNELICSFGQQQRQQSSRRHRSGSVFCRDDEHDSEGRGQRTPTHPPELPLLFTGIVLGCALLLGLVTGVAVFYARHSRGRYAVYSIYAVHVKGQQQPAQQHQHQYHQASSRGVQLKASLALPIEKAADVTPL